MHIHIAVGMTRTTSTTPTSRSTSTTPSRRRSHSSNRRRGSTRSPAADGYDVQSGPIGKDISGVDHSRFGGLDHGPGRYGNVIGRQCRGGGVGRIAGIDGGQLLGGRVHFALLLTQRDAVLTGIRIIRSIGGRSGGFLFITTSIHVLIRTRILLATIIITIPATTGTSLFQLHNILRVGFDRRLQRLFLYLLGNLLGRRFLRSGNPPSGILRRLSSGRPCPNRPIFHVGFGPGFHNFVWNTRRETIACEIMTMILIS